MKTFWSRWRWPYFNPRCQVVYRCYFITKFLNCSNDSFYMIHRPPNIDIPFPVRAVPEFKFWELSCIFPKSHMLSWAFKRLNLSRALSLVRATAETQNFDKILFLKAGLNLSWFDDFAQNFAILEPDILLVLYADNLGVNESNIINISMMNPENLIFILLAEDFKSC